MSPLAAARETNIEGPPRLDHRRRSFVHARQAIGQADHRPTARRPRRVT